MSYFDPVRMTIIDPMHNLFLGSAKIFTQKLLINSGVLDKSKLQKIQEHLQNAYVPTNIGRLPTKIESGDINYSFTANQPILLISG